MELWIRSQDRTALTQVDNIVCIENRIVFVPNRVPGRVTLGIYCSEERALEVLNEIQYILECVVTTDQEYKHEVVIGGNMFYEMPEE